MGILMKNGVNYTGFGAKNIAIAHYDSIGIPQVFFSDKAGNKINCGDDPRYITTITTDPIAFFKWKWENDGAWVGYGAISLRPLTYGTDYSHNTEWADLVDPLTLSINGVTVYVYREKGAWAFSNNPDVVINDTYHISNLYATDADITATSKFMKDIVATLTDGYTLPQEAVVRYSTEERVVGTWIDGKPLYQKTFSFNYDTAVADWTLFDNSIAYGVLVDYTIIRIKNTESIIVFPDVDSSNAIRFRISNGEIDYFLGSDREYSGYVTFKYTKTID